MKKLIKYLAVVLTMVLLASMLYACRGEDEPSAATPEPPAQATPVPDPAPPADPEPETVYLHIFNTHGPVAGEFDQDDPIWQNNPMSQQIYEDLNIRINWEFPSGDGNERLNLLLAAGDYPEIILGPNAVTFTRIVSEGIALPLDGLIDSYGANIRAAFGDILELLRSENGNIYSLSRDFGVIPPGVDPPGMGSGLIVRNDAWEAVGAPALNSLDDVYDVLIQFAELFPYNHEGASVWPMGGFLQGWQNPFQTVLGAAGVENDIWYVTEDDEIVYWVRSPQALEIVLFFNRLYREGLLDPEAFILDRGTWTTNKVANPRTISFFGGWWMAWTIHNTYIEAGIENAENMHFVPVPFYVSPDQRHWPRLVPVGGRPGTRSVMISETAPNPEAAMRLFDYLTIPENNFAVMNGVEGIMWEFEGGIPVMRPEFQERWLAGEPDQAFSAETGLRLFHQIIGTSVGRSPWDTYWILKDDPIAMNDERGAVRDANLGPYWFDTFATGGINAGAPDNYSMIYTRMGEMFHNDLYVVIMSASEAEAITAFHGFVDGLEAIGLVEYEAFANRVRNSRLGR
ncbi:MAG: extracellular solute-binding protein [Defluviitaleaceae bacterium]|nr:extracellular solute-binding protein [Defluviitaleaceae bacterium]